MDCADEICFVAGNVNRMKEYLDCAKNANNVLGCKEPKCVVEWFLNLLYLFLGF